MEEKVDEKERKKGWIKAWKIIREKGQGGRTGVEEEVKVREEKKS